MSPRATRDSDAGYAIGLPVAVGVVVILAWQAVVRAAGIPAVILPAPTDIVASFSGIGGDLAHHAWMTGAESLLAFAAAIALGIAAALVFNASTIALETFYPHMVILQVIPKIALAPLFVFWFGIDSASRLAYSVFISFFPVALAAMTGLTKTDANALRLSRALTASRWQTFVTVQVPYSLPYLFSGLKVAATMSVIGIVVGEFISAREGLGYYILYFQARGETAHVFAAILVLCLVGLVPYGLTVAAERRVRTWWYG